MCLINPQQEVTIIFFLLIVWSTDFQLVKKVLGFGGIISILRLLFHTAAGLVASWTLALVQGTGSQKLLKCLVSSNSSESLCLSNQCKSKPKSLHTSLVMRWMQPLQLKPKALPKVSNPRTKKRQKGWVSEHEKLELHWGDWLEK